MIGQKSKYDSYFDRNIAEHIAYCKIFVLNKQ